MQGYNVLHPMGWDAFGLPAENYAIKTKIHPRETTEQAIQTFRAQIKRMGLSYDWTREISAHTSEYYKWTQWFFLLLYKHGLAYKAKANVNWCSSCQTVLANEQVVEGKCERCATKVVQKELDQWFFKITDFAEDLVKDLDGVDWPDSTVRNQREWIGRSEGALLKFQITNSKSQTNSNNQITNSKQEISVFTTRPDTLFGATYLVLSPEHREILHLKPQITNWEEAEKYIEKTRQKTELERIADGKEKTGVELKGIKAVNPANNAEIPVYIADYVLAHYGTGAIMAVPAHDQRDFEFAQTYNLPITQVICNHYPAPTCPVLEEAYTGTGYLVGSGQFDGMEHEKAKRAVTEFVRGTMKTTYKLRDWLISRQRYWGAPIPIVYDPEGRPHPIPEEHLPWLLPTDVEFKPSGHSPLADSKELAERTEKIFGKGWHPEVDTMDTFVCSSWYYFRFADPRNAKEFASEKQIQQWLPVDLYMGGAEHTVLHLMYARFFTKALRKLGYVKFTEPFQKLRHQGLILGEDRHKMSKSRGNVANPDEIVKQHGADALRMYEMFMGPLEDSKPWDMKNILGVRRFLERAWKLQAKVRDETEDGVLQTILHQTIKKVGKDIEALKLNTAISQLMICANAMDGQENISMQTYHTFLLLLAPFCPFIAAELWELTGGKGSVHGRQFPSYNPSFAKEENIKLVLQVNGKVRDIAEVGADLTEEAAKELALNSEKVKKWLHGKTPRKVVYVQGKLVNIVL
ncbi:MAG: leucine--tRNA ligase, partial [Candidatus Wildermuthbacteria bacterium]|nr:leucine--tRNA ligase [Candidatus Wildermuthbacteria bacterium]